MTKSAIGGSEADPMIGATFGGRYTIISLIARGGVGVVYLARDTKGQRDVVVKLLALEWMEDADALARFEREAERLADARHPNIVEMLGHGQEHGRAYLAMERVEGELLSELIDREGALDTATFVPIAAQMLKGIGHAHSRELMVRDIKPRNIMLCQRKGRANFVKILDFGLAKLLTGEKVVTGEQVLGTEGFLAPEAIQGKAVDLRVDVYALGVVFFNMLSGRLPFPAEDKAAALYQTVHDAPPKLAELIEAGSDVDEGLFDLVDRCLEKDRDARPADANALVEELIDVIPAAYFRLPRVEDGSVLKPAPPGYGNTGMVELVGRAAQSGTHLLPADPGSSRIGLRAVTSPLPGLEPQPEDRSGPLVTTVGRGTSRRALLPALPGSDRPPRAGCPRGIRRLAHP